MSQVNVTAPWLKHPAGTVHSRQHGRSIPETLIHLAPFLLLVLIYCMLGLTSCVSVHFFFFLYCEASFLTSTFLHAGVPAPEAAGGV